MFQVFKGNGKTITWEPCNAINTLKALQPGNLCSTGRGLCHQRSQNGLREGKLLLPSSPSHSTLLHLCRAQTTYKGWDLSYLLLNCPYI